MSDYIITCDDEVAGWVGNDVESMRPLVRCRDCKDHEEDMCVHWIDEYGNVLLTLTKPTDFCSWAERRA